MFNLKITTKSKWDEALKLAKNEAQRQLDLSMIDQKELKSHIAMLERQINSLQQKLTAGHKDLKEIEKRSKGYSDYLQKSMTNEAQLRTAMREIVSSFKKNLPEIKISNEQLIQKLNACFKELQHKNDFQLKLMQELSENPSIEMVRKISDYVKSYKKPKNETLTSNH